MNIPDILNKATEFITHFNFAAFLKSSKIGVILFAIISIAVIIFGIIFSLIPQL